MVQIAQYEFYCTICTIVLGLAKSTNSANNANNANSANNVTQFLLHYLYSFHRDLIGSTLFWGRGPRKMHRSCK